MANAVVWVKHDGNWNKLTQTKKIAGQSQGYTKSGGGAVRERLTELTVAGRLRLTGDEIAAFAAVAEVETGGQIGCVQTYDDQVLSVGFKQVVLGHGSLEKVMEAAPSGFAKHGLALDRSKRYAHPKWGNNPHQIEGCEVLQELRSPEWAIKFYHASMEPDVIAAICDVALPELRRVERTTAAKRDEVQHDFFDDLVAKSWLLEVYNNRPAFMKKVVDRASLSPALTRDAFLDLLANAIMDTYETEEPMIAYRRAKAQYKESHRGQEMSTEAAEELLATKQQTLGAAGRKKGKNIITKISRTLAPADISRATAAAPTTTAASTGRVEIAAGSVPSRAPNRADLTAGYMPEPARIDIEGHEAEDRQRMPQSVEATDSNDLPTPVATASTMRVTVATLNVRSAANTDARIIGTLRRGETVHGTLVGRSWASIQFRGRPGFVHRDYVESTTESGPAEVDTFGMGDALVALPGALRGLSNAMGTGLSWLASGVVTARERRPEGHTHSVPASASTASPRSPATPLPITTLADPDLEQLVTQLSSPEVTSIAGDLADLKSRSRALTLSRKEEQGTARDQLVEDIGALRARLEALPEADAAIDAFRGRVYRSILEIAPYYYQSRNIDILESPPPEQTRTCNITVLGMALESLGKSPAAFEGHRPSLLAAARIYRGKIIGDDVSTAAVDATAGRGTSWEQLIGMRFPDFLELAAIAREAGGATEEEAVKAAAQTAWDSILGWSFLQELASDFGVTATIKYFDASGIQSNRRPRSRTRSDQERIRTHGNVHRMPVEHHINARLTAQAPDSTEAQNRAVEARRPAYQAAVADEGIDEQVSLETYRTHLLEQVGQDIDAGHVVIVGLANHFVRLQSLDQEHIIVDDPARDSRSATLLTYAEARAMGYFHMRFILS